jgi:hypothetical protein
MNPSQQDSCMYWGNGSGNGTVYEISVDVVIHNVTDMDGWQFGLFWNNSVLNCDSVVISNPISWTNTINITQDIDNNYNSTNGHYLIAMGDEDSNAFSGTLPIATLTFHQIANVSATTPLNFDSVEVCDEFGNNIDCSTTDGSVVMHTGSKPPSPATVAIIGNGDTIQLGPWPSNWANWQCSQSNDGDTSYVCSSFDDSNQYYDLYNASFWLPANATNIIATVHIVVRSTSATHKAMFNAAIKASSTGLQFGNAYSPTIAYQDDSSNFTITQSDGATLQIGVQIVSAHYRVGGTWNYYPGYCTEVYAVITWS